MNILITEEQLQNILFEDADELIKKRLKTLYLGFRKGKMKVQTNVHRRASSTEEQNIDIEVRYELPSLFRIVVNDKERRRKIGWSYGMEPNSIYINDLKIDSDTPIPDEIISQIKTYVKDKLERRFKQMGNADLIFTKFRAPDLKFQSDFKKGDTLKLLVGQPIEHDKFGKGEIIDLQNIDGKKIATIKFATFGMKKIILGLANLRTWEQ